MKKRKVCGLVVCGAVSGVLLIFCSGTVCVGEDDTGATQVTGGHKSLSANRNDVAKVPDVFPQVAECGEAAFRGRFLWRTCSRGMDTFARERNGLSFEGVLQGRASTKEFQQKRIAAGNTSHSGKTPSSRLLVPVDDCVMLFRFKLVDGLSGAHFGFNDGSFKTGTGHVCRFTVSARKGQSLVKDRNVTVDGDEDEILVTDSFNVKADTWYWMMLEIVGDEMVAQVSGGPVLRARHPRFNIPKDQINLPTRGGGVMLYDNVRVWNARPRGGH